MRFYKLPVKSDKGADMFVDLDQVETVACRLDQPATPLADAVAGRSAPPIPIVRLGTVAGRNIEFSPGSVEDTEQWLQTQFGLSYEFDQR